MCAHTHKKKKNNRVIEDIEMEKYCTRSAYKEVI